MQQKNPVSLFFRARLRALLDERKLSQRQLALATGVSQQTINNYLRGVTKLPGAEELLALSRHFGVTMEYFLADDETGRQAASGTGHPSSPPSVPASEVVQAAKRMQCLIEELCLEAEHLERLGGAK